VHGPEVTRILGTAAATGGNGDGAIRGALVGNGATLSGFTLAGGHTRTSETGPGNNPAAGFGATSKVW